MFRIQDNESIICRFYFNVFIEYMLAGKTLLDYANLLFPNDCKKNDKKYISILEEYKYFRIYQINVLEEASLEFRLRKINEARNSFLDEIKSNLMSEKDKNTCKYLNYVEHSLLLASTVTGCVSIYAFVSSVCVPLSITSSVVGIKNCAIIVGNKKYGSTKIMF